MPLKGRPGKKESVVIAKRNREIVRMNERYPVEYLASFYNLTEGRVSQILKNAKINESGL
jgi:hypothetical protein